MATGNITIIEAESRFKKIDKSLIENHNIDCLTLGVYAKMVVLGKKWQLNVSGLRKHLGLSDEKVRKALSLLEKEGYIVRTPCRNEKGQMSGWDYTIHPTPTNENERSQAGFKSDNRPTETPTPPKTDHTDTGGDINNRLNRTIDLIDLEEKEDNKLSSEKKELTWREDFNLFHAEVEKAKTILIADRDFKAKQEVYYPNLDYELSLQKMVEDYWGTETAWNKRKKQKKNGEGIDMVATLKKAFNQSCNRVYKRKTFSQPQLFNSYSYKKVGERASDYLSTLKVDVDFEMNGIKYLKDGTYINDGKRYYKTKFGLLKEIPIGLVARPSEDWEYDNNSMVWVQDERTETIEDMLF